MISARFQGRRVCIFEKYSREQILEPRDMDRSFNIYIAPFVLRTLAKCVSFDAERAAPRTHWCKGVVSTRGSAVVRKPALSRGFHRSALVKALLETCDERASAGADLMLFFGTTVTAAQQAPAAGKGVRLHFQSSAPLADSAAPSSMLVDAVLDCSGIHSPLRKHAFASGASELHVPSSLPPYRYRSVRLSNMPSTIAINGAVVSDMHEWLYADSLFRVQFTGVEGKYLCVCTQPSQGAVPEAWMSSDFHEFMEAFKAKVPELTPYVDTEQAASPIGSITPSFCNNLRIEGGTVMFFGDAAAVTRPTMGQGINCGLRGAIAFFEALVQEENLGAVSGESPFVRAGRTHESVMLHEQESLVRLSEELSARLSSPLMHLFAALQATLVRHGVLSGLPNQRLLDEPDLLYADARANFLCEWNSFVELASKLRASPGVADDAIARFFFEFVASAIAWKIENHKLPDDQARFLTDRAWVRENLYPSASPLLKPLVES